MYNLCKNVFNCEFKMCTLCIYFEYATNSTKNKISNKDNNEI